MYVGVVAVHVVVFLAAFVPLGVAAAVGDGDEDDGGNALLGDQVVEDGLVTRCGSWAGAVVDDHERRFGAWLVLGGNVDRDRTLVVDGVRLDDQRLRVVRIDLAELLAGDARIEEFRLLRVDHELLHLPLRDSLHRFAFRRGDILRPDDEIVIRIEWWILPLFQHLERRSAFVVVVAYWLCYRQTGACESHDQGERGQLVHKTPSESLRSSCTRTALGRALLSYSRSSASVRLDLIRLPLGRDWHVVRNP